MTTTTDGLAAVAAELPHHPTVRLRQALHAPETTPAVANAIRAELAARRAEARDLPHRGRP